MVSANKSKETIMPFHRRARDRTIAAFLETSRIHFNLNPPRSRPALHRWLATPHLRSLLIAGSLGALFGAPVMANTAIDTVRDLELRSNKTAPARHGVPGDIMRSVARKQ
jgi:hypothetical protein